MPWVAILLVVELVLDLGCLLGSLRWCVAGDPERARLPLRLGAAATILHALRVLVYALGRTVLLRDFDVRPERRTGIGEQGGWFWVYFASVLSILGLIGVLVIWLLRRRARKRAESTRKDDAGRGSPCPRSRSASYHVGEAFLDLDQPRSHRRHPAGFALKRIGRSPMCTRVLVPFIALSIVGCREALQPPSDLTAAESGPFDEILITWVEPSGEVDGYELDGRIAGGSWERLNTDLIPRGVTGDVLTLDPSTPELTTFGFRIRSVKGGARSEWSPEAPYLRGIHPPTALVADTSWTPDGLWRIPPVSLAWSNNSLVATDLLLERAPASGSGAGTFSPVGGVAFGETSHQDGEVTEGAWQYRVRYGKDGIWSRAAFVTTNVIDIVPPAALVAAKTASGVELGWSNRSTVAEQLVYRIDPSPAGTVLLTTLPVGASAYLDPFNAPWPATRYGVTGVAPSGATATTEVALGALTLTGPVTLAGSAALAPVAGPYTGIARSDASHFHIAAQLPAVVYRDTGSGWEQHSLAGAVNFAAPAVLADENGNPHVVYYGGYPDLPDTPLMHERFDGAAWRSEQIVLAPADGATFALTPGGVVHVLVRRRESSGSYTTVHRVGSAGVWVATDLTATTLPQQGNSIYYEWGRDMGVAADGTAWVVLTYSAPPLPDTWFVLFRRSAAGIWSEELVPFGSQGTAAVVPGQGQSAGLFYEQVGSGSHGTSFRLRSEAGWGPEETAAVPFADMSRGVAALAADGQRVHALFSKYPDGLWLTVRTPDGWQPMQLGSPAPWLSLIGLTADGKITVTVLHESSPPAKISAFVEVP